jgi:class 3 adenylate cyclase
LLVALVLAFFISRAYSTALARLVDESERIQRLDLTPPPPLETRLREISQLAQAHERMRLALDAFSRYVPTAVVRELLRRGEAARIDGREEVLTVFFSDIRGFTTISESLEPSALTQQMAEYFEAMLEVLQSEGATIDKFIGDAVMVFFGDDDETDPAEGAYRCVGMALEMQTDVGRLLDGMSLGADRRLLTRMGINTGVCTVGNFGSVTHRMSYTAIGGAVNIASRLEGAAPPGGLLISGATYHLIADRILAEPRGALKLKGVSHPVETYEVLGLAGETLAGRSTLTELDGGFRLAPLALVPGVTSRIERHEMALALRAALRLIEEP